MHAILFILITACLCNALTEEELVRFSLSNSHAIKRYLLAVKKDALEAKRQAKDNSLDITASADAGISRATGATHAVLSDSETVSAQLRIIEPVRGGGEISASVGWDKEAGNRITAGATQPLLKGTFSGSVKDYNEDRAALLHAVSKEENLFLVASHLADILASFWQAYLKQETVRILATADTIAELTYKQSKVRFTMGDATVIDTLEALLSLNNSRTNRLTAESELRHEQRNLMDLTGLKTADELFPTDSIRPDPAVADSFRNLAMRVNADLLREERLLQVYELDRRFSDNWRLPELTLSAAYEAQDRTGFPRDGGYRVGLGFSYRLLNNSRFEIARKAAIDAEQQKLTIDEKRARLENSLREIFENLDLKSRTLKNEDQSVEVAGLKNRTANTLYRQGQIDIITRLKSDDDFIRARLRRLSAATDIMMLKLRLDLLTDALPGKYGIGLAAKVKE